MKQSKLFYKTEKKISKEADIASHRFLFKGGFVDQLSSGLYNFLPLGYLVHKKIEEIIREEMNNIGGQEVFLPALQPKQIWEKSGRWKTIDPPLFKLKDRHKKDFALGSTHEEVITQLVQKKINSYRDLPIYLFQIQTKFRNELRFSGGLLRTREFVMKDLYSFHENQEDFEKYYQKAIKAYFRIFKRCGLNPLLVEASGLGFTENITHEFQVLTPVGEDRILYCPKCRYAQNEQIASLKKGGRCPKCRKGIIKMERGIEVGNVFPLGHKYADSFNLYFTDQEGKKKPVIMGCYGIGIGRLMAAVAELNHDEKGIIWPCSLAPFSVHIIPVEINDKGVVKTAEKIYQDLQKLGAEVIYDDRKNVNIGEKLIEADLIGIPLRLIVSQKTLMKKSVELKERNKKKSSLVKINQIKLKI